MGMVRFVVVMVGKKVVYCMWAVIAEMEFVVERNGVVPFAVTMLFVLFLYKECWWCFRYFEFIVESLLQRVARNSAQPLPLSDRLFVCLDYCEQFKL
jgi:hypothetical protein